MSRSDDTFIWGREDLQQLRCFALPELDETLSDFGCTPYPMGSRYTAASLRIRCTVIGDTAVSSAMARVLGLGLARPAPAPV